MKNFFILGSGTTPPDARPRLKRRHFVHMLGGFTFLSATLLSCDDDNGSNSSDGVDLGSGDSGLLNYSYMLDQLESSFYDTVVTHEAFNSIFSTREQQLISEIRDNERVHLEFYRTALGTNAIKDLETDFTGIDFANRTSILKAAHAFEDTGVAAYNGAAQLLTDTNNLAVSGKIASIEARHAAILRNMLKPKSNAFAGNDIVNPMGLDVAMMPFEVIPMAQGWLKTKINGNNLPNA
jgi:hypothetical protein